MKKQLESYIRELLIYNSNIPDIQQAMTNLTFVIERGTLMLSHVCMIESLQEQINMSTAGLVKDETQK